MKRFLAIILIVFTLGLFFNNLVNWHYHELPNGIIVEHAHPFERTSSASGSPFENHHHSDFEYLILDLIYYSGLIFILLFLGIIVYFKFEDRADSFRPIMAGVEQKSLLPLLRAPPQFYSIIVGFYFSKFFI